MRKRANCCGAGKPVTIRPFEGNHCPARQYMHEVWYLLDWRTATLVFVDGLWPWTQRRGEKCGIFLRFPPRTKEGTKPGRPTVTCGSKAGGASGCRVRLTPS